MSEKTLGQVGYEAYQATKGGLTYDGKPIPAWDALTGDVGAAVQNAWEVTARAAADEMIDRWGLDVWIRKACAKAKGETRTRETALVLTKLEEALMWWGAAFPVTINWNSPTVTAMTKSELAAEMDEAAKNP